jgi:hypothetical protein
LVCIFSSPPFLVVAKHFASHLQCASKVFDQITTGACKAATVFLQISYTVQSTELLENA